MKNNKTLSRIGLMLVGLLAFGPLASNAALWHRVLLTDLEQKYVETLQFGVASSTTATIVSGSQFQSVGIQYSVSAFGGDVSYTIRHTLGTTGGVAVLSESPVQTALDGFTAFEEWRILVENPEIIVHDLPAGATALIRISYGLPQR